MACGIKLDAGSNSGGTQSMGSQRDVEFGNILGQVLQRQNEVLLICDESTSPEKGNRIRQAKETGANARNKLLQMKARGEKIENIQARAKEFLDILNSIPKYCPIDPEQTKGRISALRERIVSTAIHAGITPENVKTTFDVGLSLGAGLVAGQTAGRIYKNRVETAHGKAVGKSIQADQAADTAKNAQFKAEQAKVKAERVKIEAEQAKIKARTKHRYAKSHYETVKNSVAKLETRVNLSPGDKGKITSLSKLKENSSTATEAYRTARKAEKFVLGVANETAQAAIEAAKVAAEAAKMAAEASQEAVQAGARAANKVVPQVVTWGTGTVVAGTVFLATRVAAAPLNWALNSTELGNADLPMPFDEPAPGAINKPRPLAPEKERISVAAAKLGSEQTRSALA